MQNYRNFYSPLTLAEMIYLLKRNMKEREKDHQRSYEIIYGKQAIFWWKRSQCCKKKFPPQKSSLCQSLDNDILFLLFMPPLETSHICKQTKVYVSF